MSRKISVIMKGTKALVSVDPADLLWVEGRLYYTPTGEECGISAESGFLAPIDISEYVKKVDNIE